MNQVAIGFDYLLIYFAAEMIILFRLFVCLLLKRQIFIRQSVIVFDCVFASDASL